MANTPKYFGQSNSTVAVPHSLFGMSGWWQVPPNVYVRPFASATNQWEVSPNADFSPPIYYARMDGDGTMVFQDQLANRITQNGEQEPGPFFNNRC